MSVTRRKLIGSLACLILLSVVGVSLVGWFQHEPETQLLDAAGRTLIAGSAASGDEFDANESPFSTALALMKRRQFAEAQVELLRVIEQLDQDGQACVLLSDVHRELHDLPAALNYGQKAVELMPESAPAHLAYAKALGAQLSRDVKSVTGMLSAMKGLGLFKAELDRVIQLNPADTEARATLLFTNLAPRPWGNIQRAFALCNEIELHDAPLGIQLRAVCLQADKKHEQAIEILRDGIDRYPSDLTFRVTLADIYFEQKKLDLADAEYDLVISGPTDQTYYRALFGKARLRIESQFELEQAIDLLDQFISASPESEGLVTASNALCRKGAALELMQKMSEARLAYEECLRRDPGFEPAHEALAKLGR
jgi:tetratricopeptide (TPR) repeat protein